VPDAPLTITTEPILGDAERISTTYDHLPDDVKPGDHILIADGTMELQVESVKGREVNTVVLRGGMLGESKGMNLPRIDVSAPALTTKDLEDLRFGVGLGVDFVALSFVRSAKDIVLLRDHLQELGRSPAIVAKIERPEAIANFDAILGETDAVMVARGDLGVEMNLADIPQVQKELIRKCNDLGTPVITATQMLESMVESALPTRAEVNDIANAIYDGTDAVMLSGETAAGKYPVEAVRMMASVAEQADEAIRANPTRPRIQRAGDARVRRNSFADAIGEAVNRVTQVLNASRIVCLTRSGSTAVAISRFRPPLPIDAVSSSESTVRRCALYWGVHGVHIPLDSASEEMVRRAEAALLEQKIVRRGETVIIVAGLPYGHTTGRTNMMKLHAIGDPV
jgi:pyruvate kinase